MTEDYKNLSDKELADASVSGDEAAFAEIVRRYSPRVFHYSARYFRRYSLVEEAAQEVFMKAFTQLKNYEGRGSLEGWLTRITVTTCINILRATKPQNEMTVSDLTDDESEWLEERLMNAATVNQQTQEDRLIAADLINRVLDILPPEEAVILQMLDGEGASVRETATAMDWTESKVKTKAFRARRKMREAVQKLLNAKDGKLLNPKKLIDEQTTYYRNS